MVCVDVCIDVYVVCVCRVSDVCVCECVDVCRCVWCVCAQSEWHVWYINHMNVGCVHSVRVIECEREGEDVWYRVCVMWGVGCVVCV